MPQKKFLISRSLTSACKYIIFFSFKITYDLIKDKYLREKKVDQEMCTYDKYILRCTVYHKIHSAKTYTDIFFCK